MFKKLLEYFTKRFVEKMGRKPQTASEFMSIQNDVVRYLNKTKGDPKKLTPQSMINERYRAANPFIGFKPTVVQFPSGGIHNVPVKQQFTPPGSRQVFEVLDDEAYKGLQSDTFRRLIANTDDEVKAFGKRIIENKQDVKFEKLTKDQRKGILNMVDDRIKMGNRKFMEKYDSKFPPEDMASGGRAGYAGGGWTDLIEDLHPFSITPGGISRLKRDIIDPFFKKKIKWDELDEYYRQLEMDKDMKDPENVPRRGERYAAEGGIARVGMLMGGFTKAEVLIQMLKNTIKGSKDPYVKKTFPKWIKELQKNPKLALDENVWKELTRGLPKNQRLVVHSDDSVDFFRQTEFGPHNIEKTLEFQKKHNLSRDQANTILRMEPEDRVLEMKRLETLADRSRTKQASGGIAGQLHLNEDFRVPAFKGLFTGSKGLQALIKRLRGKEKTLFPKFPKQDEKLMKTIMPRETETIKSLNIQQLENLLEALKNDKKMIAQLEANKAMKDPGLDFLMGKMNETGLMPKNLGKYTDIDKDIMVVEQMLKNRTMKDRKLNAEGGIAGQLHLNRPGYRKGNRVNPFEETGNLPGGAYDTREYIQSPILAKEDKGITTVKAPPKKATFEEIMSKHLGDIKDKRPKHFYFEKDAFGNVKLDELGKPIKRKFRMGPATGFGIRDKTMENLTKVMKAVELAELNKEQSDHFWNKFGLEFGIKGEEFKALKAGKKYFKKENLPLINLNEDTLLNITKGLDLPKNTQATLFAESNLGGDVNASLEVANNIFNTKLTKDDVSWDIKPTFNVGEIEIAPSVKGTDDVIEKIKLAVGNPNWSIEGELIKAQKRKETGGAPDQETQRIMQMLMADPMLWRWFGGSRGMMNMFGDTMTEEQKGDILKLSGSYTFDNDFKISPSLEQDLLTNDTTYGLGINQGDFSSNLKYDDDLTGSVAYGPVQVGTTGDGARLDLNKNIKTFYADEAQKEPIGSLDIKGFYDTKGNWNIGPTFHMTFGGPKKYDMVEGITESGQKRKIPKTWDYEGTTIAELKEALQPKKLYARGGLASLNNYATKRTE